MTTTPTTDERADAPESNDEPDDPLATETAVPDGTDAAECERCGRPLPDPDLLALHRGLAHYDDLSPEDRVAYRSAYAAETAALRVFRLQAIAALVALYFGFLFAYAAFG